MSPAHRAERMRRIEEFFADELALEKGAKPKPAKPTKLTKDDAKDIVVLAAEDKKRRSRRR